jgi:hypothetical protein
MRLTPSGSSGAAIPSSQAIVRARASAIRVCVVVSFVIL